MRALCSGPNWQASSHLHNRNVTRQVTNVSSSLSNWKEDGSFCTPKVRDFLDGPNTQSSRRIEAARWLSGNFLGSEDDQHGRVPNENCEGICGLRAGAYREKAARRYRHRKNLRCVHFGGRIPRCSWFLAPLTEDAVAFEDHSEFYCCDACGFQAC